MSFETISWSLAGALPKPQWLPHPCQGPPRGCPTGLHCPQSLGRGQLPSGSLRAAPEALPAVLLHSTARQGHLCSTCAATEGWLRNGPTSCRSETRTRVWRREPGAWSPTLTPVSERRGVHGRAQSCPSEGRRQNCEGKHGGSRVSLCQTAGDWSCSVHWRSSSKMGEKSQKPKTTALPRAGTFFLCSCLGHAPAPQSG